MASFEVRSEPGTGREAFYVDTAYRFIHEDRDILVVDKPAPLAVHAVGAYKELNLQTLLQRDPRLEGTPIKTVHRLDAETSGVLLIAKTHEAASFLGRQFTLGRVAKKYEAIVFGCPSAAKGDITDRLGFDASSGFQTVRVRDEVSGEPAHTRYEVLESCAEYARVRLTPFTGRTHQLRIHLALIGHPIVGDKIYIDLNYFSRYVAGGLDSDLLLHLKLPRLALHATELTFDHPQDRKPRCYTSPLPPLLSDFLRAQGLSNTPARPDAL